MLVSTTLNLFVIPVFYVLFVRGKKTGNGDEPAPEPAFAEGDVSITDVFEDEPQQDDENGKKAGLINFINEEQKPDSPSPNDAENAKGRNDHVDEKGPNDSSSNDDPDNKK